MSVRIILYKPKNNLKKTLPWQKLTFWECSGKSEIVIWVNPGKSSPPQVFLEWFRLPWKRWHVPEWHSRRFPSAPLGWGEVWRPGRPTESDRQPRHSSEWQKLLSPVRTSTQTCHRNDEWSQWCQTQFMEGHRGHRNWVWDQWVKLSPSTPDLTLGIKETHHHYKCISLITNFLKEFRCVSA